MAYETFAFVYDEVMDKSLYDKWLAFAKRHLGSRRQVLELACGTGALAVAFAKEGYEVTALDLSEEMLMMASERAYEEQVDIQLLAGDMQDLQGVGTFEAVTCFSDSLCYMPDAPSVQQVFDEVYHVLDDEGVFVFDVHSQYQINEVFPEYSYHYQTDEFAFLWDSYQDAPDTIQHFLTFFVPENPGTDEVPSLFIRQDEVHEERTYPLNQYVSMLENSGFRQVNCYADFIDSAPNEKSRRWFFVCQK